jgi:hypothetical protein
MGSEFQAYTLQLGFCPISPLPIPNSIHGVKIQNYNKFSAKIELTFTWNSRIGQYLFLGNKVSAPLSTAEEIDFLCRKRLKKEETE